MTQITERLFIGDKRDQPFSTFTAILNLAADLQVLRNEKAEFAQFGLIDGPGNRNGALIAAVLMLHQMLERHSSVIVICHGGSGRSGLIVALYLAVRHETNWDQALAIVIKPRPVSHPNQALLSLVPTVIPLLQKLFKEGI